MSTDSPDKSRLNDFLRFKPSEVSIWLMDQEDNQELEKIVRKGVDSYNFIKNNEGNRLMPMMVDNTYYTEAETGRAAFSILVDRRGSDYALSVIGLRKPVGLFEKTIYFLTKDYPSNGKLVTDIGPQFMTFDRGTID